MRFSLAAIAMLTLAACDQAPQQKAEAPPVAPSEPAAIKTYDLAGVRSVNGGAVTLDPSGAQVKTDARSGAFSASLDLGEDAKQSGLAVRVKVQVSSGAFQIISFHRGFEAGDKPAATKLAPAGDALTIELPIDDSGRPMLVIGNGAKEGPSVGAIRSVELVRASALRGAGE